MQTTPRTLGDLTVARTRTKQLADIADYIISKALRQPLRDSTNRLEKAALASIGTADLGVLRTETQVFADVIDEQTVPGQVRDLMVNAPPFAAIPAAANDDPSSAWIGEGLLMPLARSSLTAFRTAPTKIGTLEAFTADVLRFGDPRAQNIILSKTARGQSRAINAAFLGDAPATDAQPAGILNNVLQSGGGSPTSLQSDLDSLFGAVVDGRSQRPIFVTSGRAALYLLGSDLQAFRDVRLTGGSIAGARLIVTPAAGNRLILFDASEIAYFDGGLEIQSSEEAAIQMSDSPTPGATEVVSAWQVNMAVVKLVRFIHWIRLRDDAAGYVELDLSGSPA